VAVDPRIIPGARRAIELHGWQGATLERIAAEAGTSRMTLHRRGITRDAVLQALADTLEEQYRTALWPALTAPGSGRVRLEQALEALCGVMEENLALIAALDDRPRDAIFHEDEAGSGLTRSTFTGPVERILRDGAADGSLRATEDPAETATVLFNLIGWTYRHLRRGHGWGPERAARGLLSIVLDGVAGEDSALAGANVAERRSRARGRTAS
jgi:AcrR family transcriptional regulator